MPEYWQIAAGDWGRNYAAYFLDHGLAFVGGESHVKRILLLQAGDRVLLKRGTGKVIAVGEVVERNGRVSGDARDTHDSDAKRRQWLRDFDGWDLSGWCHVRWHDVPLAQQETGGLTRGTLKRCKVEQVKLKAETILATQPPRADIRPEPNPTEPVGDNDLLRHLVGCGLRVAAAEELTGQLGRIRLLADYYYGLDDWSLVKEHETRTFLVAPLLLALGWAEQQLKIEFSCTGGSVDVACFRDPFAGSDASQCVMLIETKGLSQGLDLAPDQAKHYALDFLTCNLLLVTNGVHYKAYSRVDKDSFTAKPIAYLNLRKPTSRYPLDPTVAGALEAVELLLPNVAARQRPIGSITTSAAA